MFNVATNYGTSKTCWPVWKLVINNQSRIPFFGECDLWNRRVHGFATTLWVFLLKWCLSWWMLYRLCCSFTAAKDHLFVTRVHAQTLTTIQYHNQRWNPATSSKKETGCRLRSSRPNTKFRTIIFLGGFFGKGKMWCPCTALPQQVWLIEYPT